ncbi:hypothetical protein [Flavobacterium pedocola]
MSQIEFITIEQKKVQVDAIKPITHNKNSRRNKTKITVSREEYEAIVIKWKLRKFIGIREDNNSGIDWVYQGAAQELKNEMTAESILKFLNNTTVFDFAYEPKQNDELIIELEYVIAGIKGKYSRPFIGEYISLLYNDEKWTSNKGYDSIYFIMEDFKEGIIKCVA